MSELLIQTIQKEIMIPGHKMFLPRLCTLLSVFLLWKLPSIHAGAVKQPVQSRALKGGILKSVEEAWDDTARVTTASVETRCRKPSRRLQKGSSKSSKGGKGGKGGYTGNSLSMNMSKKSKSSKGDVPYCDDLSQNGVTSPPSPVPNNSEDIPMNSVPAPSPTPDNFRDCSAIVAGTARTNGSSKSFTVNANLIVNAAVPIQNILSDLRQILQQEVAPALAGCVLPYTRRRRLQVSNIFNVLFGPPGAIPDGKEIESMHVYDGALHV
jgi:hypothetical protein